jgi:2,4-dienoyl-CoA reductase-like NADH-dependent reductase (Old Yellow Enzyme family)/thioredoxin reductase
VFWQSGITQDFLTRLYTPERTNQKIDMAVLDKLFQPGMMGKVEVKNRIVMAPMCTFAQGPEGEILDKTVEYYAARARGGVGFIMGQTTNIMRESRTYYRSSVYDDKFIPGLKKIADAYHQNGSRGAFQVSWHGRLYAKWRNDEEEPEKIKPLAPSPITEFLTPYPKDLTPDLAPVATKEDIKRVTNGYAEAARRVKEAGFDAVSVHGGHGYGLCQFLSPLANRRTDEYGGSVEKRARFACEVLEAVRKKVGADYTIIFRYSGSDFLEGGITLEDSVRQAHLFVEAGADVLDISASEQASTQYQFVPFAFPQGVIIHLAEAVKKVVKVPVVTVGKISDPDFANEVIKQGKADFVALGRALVADPDWANKAQEGRADDIRHCVYCLNCANSPDHPYIFKEGLTCAVNPANLKEKEYAIKPTPVSKKVMVIGAGPAGMEAARTLAERGHQVNLYEKTDKLGGQWYIASQQELKKQDYPRVIEHMSLGLTNARVKIRMNTEVTPELVKEIKPDVAVVATGAVPQSLDIQGADGDNVVQANDLILGKAKVGDKVVVIGGRYLGIEIADELHSQGKQVTLVTRRALGRGVQRDLYLTLRNRIIEKGIQFFANAPVTEINEKGVYIVFDERLAFIPADTVVMAVGVKPENRLIEALKGIVPEVYAIGDCVQPRDLMEATREAAKLAHEI